MLRSTLAQAHLNAPTDAIVLESFLIHARNLIEFFFDGAPKRAVLPKDFGAPSRRDKDQTIKSLHDEISQLVSHLTWDRVTDHETRAQDWGHKRLQDIHDAIRLKAKQFFANIPHERVAWFASARFPHEYGFWTDAPKAPAT